MIWDKQTAGVVALNHRVIITGYAVFILALIVPRVLPLVGLSEPLEAHPTAAHFIVKSILLVFSVAAMKISGRGWRDFGIGRPASFRWPVPVAAAGLLGAAATCFILFTPAGGMANIRSYGILGLILSVWFYSSITEEIFVRGWLQSSLSLQPGRNTTAILVSGLFFGSMHLSLIWSETDWLTIIIVVSATTLLGFLTAHLRRQQGSLLPPIAAHIAFNIGGFIAGVIINIIAIVRTGAPIQP